MDYFFDVKLLRINNNRCVPVSMCCFSYSPPNARCVIQMWGNIDSFCPSQMTYYLRTGIQHRNGICIRLVQGLSVQKHFPRKLLRTSAKNIAFSGKAFIIDLFDRHDWKSETDRMADWEKDNLCVSPFQQTNANGERKSWH